MEITIKKLENLIDNYNDDNVEQLEKLINEKEYKEIFQILKKKNLIKIQNNKIKITNKKLFIGKYISKGNFGFVDLKNTSIALFKQKKIINGDLILGEIKVGADGRLEGELIAIVEKSNNVLIGEIFNKKIIIHERSFHNYHFIADNLNLFNEGDIVELAINNVQDEVINVHIKSKIGTKNDPNLNMKIVLKQYKIKTKWDEATIDEAHKIANNYKISNFKATRQDLTKKLFMTIDGSDSKDLDDAICLEKEGSNYRIYVSIADVAHFVTYNSAIDQEAFKRGTSTYFIDRVVPMLPEILSNELCSLNPNTQKLTITCEVLLNKNAEILESSIYESIIESKKRLTYEEVNNFLNEQIISENLKDIQENLLHIYNITSQIHKQKIQRGQIELESVETKFILNENHEITGIEAKTTGPAEQLIEDLMVLANETVATTIFNKNLPFIYRTHEKPNIDKMRPLLEIAKRVGKPIKIDINKISPKALQPLTHLKDSLMNKIVSEFLLFSMSKAKYTTNNIGHFGLASPAYTHFTSPIRRYPDLIVHRLLKKYLIEKNYEVDKINNNLATIADFSSEREYASMKAEYKITDLAKAEFAEKLKGKVFKAIVVKISKFGMFVELENTLRGVVKVTSMRGYFEKENDFKLNSKNRAYHLGDYVNVKIKDINIEEGLIDFQLVEKNYKFKKQNKKRKY